MTERPLDEPPYLSIILTGLLLSGSSPWLQGSWVIAVLWLAPGWFERLRDHHAGEPSDNWVPWLTH